LQPFERRLLQQNQGMPDVVGIGLGMNTQHLLNPRCQAPRPTLGFGGGVGFSALFHANDARLIGFSDFVTGVSEQEIDLLPHCRIHLDGRRPGAFEAFAAEFLGRVNAHFRANGEFAGGVVGGAHRVSRAVSGVAPDTSSSP